LENIFADDDAAGHQDGNAVAGRQLPDALHPLQQAGPICEDANKNVLLMAAL
jgi:hypothetical protein